MGYCFPLKESGDRRHGKVRGEARIGERRQDVIVPGVQSGPDRSVTPGEVLTG
jgi:hypothetical protein